MSAVKPSEQILRDVFSIFGELRLIEIANERISYSSTIEQASSNMPLFDAYLQYKDYIGFVKAMDTFRGMKLLYIDDSRNAFTANIRIDFDRTRYLSDKEIKKREIDKLKAIELGKIKAAQHEREKEKETKQKEIANFQMMISESMVDSVANGLKEINSDEDRRAHV